MKKPGEIVKELIKERGSTQEKDAKAIGITQGALSEFISGKREFRSEQIRKLCKFYNISADYLLGLSEISSTDPDDRAICERFGLKEKDFDLLKNAFYHREELADIALELRQLANEAEYLREILCFGK